MKEISKDFKAIKMHSAQFLNYSTKSLICIKISNKSSINIVT